MTQKVIPGTNVQVVVDDAVVNDSDKSFVPAGERWRILAVFVSLTTTASAGIRQLVLRVTDGTNTLYQSAAGATQDVSLTVNYNFAQGNTREATAVAGALDVPLPTGLTVGPGQTLQVLDDAAIDATADDMTVRVLAETY